MSDVRRAIWRYYLLFDVHLSLVLALTSCVSNDIVVVDRLDTERVQVQDTVLRRPVWKIHRQRSSGTRQSGQWQVDPRREPCGQRRVRVLFGYLFLFVCQKLGRIDQVCFNWLACRLKTAYEAWRTRFDSDPQGEKYVQYMA